MKRPQFAAAFSLLLWAAGPASTSSLLSPARSRPTTVGVTVTGDNPRVGNHSRRNFFPSTRLFLTPLPKDISPFDKSASKGRDIQGDLRKLATTAIQKAFSSNERPVLMELEFPPLIGGEQSKTQFDDFDSKSVCACCILCWSNAFTSRDDHPLEFYALKRQQDNAATLVSN